MHGRAAGSTARGDGSPLRLRHQREPPDGVFAELCTRPHLQRRSLSGQPCGVEYRPSAGHLHPRGDPSFHLDPGSTRGDWQNLPLLFARGALWGKCGRASWEMWVSWNQKPCMLGPPPCCEWQAGWLSLPRISSVCVLGCVRVVRPCQLLMNNTKHDRRVSRPSTRRSAVKRVSWKLRLEGVQWKIGRRVAE